MKAALFGLVAIMGYSAATTMGYVDSPWKAMWGSALGKAQSFNYEKADDSARSRFLNAEAKTEQALSNQAMARGSGYRITDFDVDTRTKRVTFHYRLPRGERADKSSIRASKSAYLRQMCGPWSRSPLGRAGVSWRLSFQDFQKRKLGAILVSPGACSRYI